MVRRFTGVCALALSGGSVVACSSRPVQERVVYVPSSAPQAEVNRVAWSQPPVPSANVQPGRLAGIVVDQESGQPIFAQISVTSAPMVGTLTDSSGRFNLAVPSGARTIWIRRVGYSPYKIDAVLAQHSGYIMVAALTRALTTLCNVSDGGIVLRLYRDSTGKTVQTPILPPPPSAVVVYVRDALTGQPPGSPVTVTVTDGAFRDSLVARVDSLGRVPRTIAPERPGTYEVTVRNSQYRDWQSTARTRFNQECGGELVPAVFRAWLVPR